MSKLAEAVKQELLQEIYNDTLVLPTLPEAALRVREAAEAADISIAALAKEIGSDTALTARIIKVANSPLLRARQEITDLQTAISRLGINFTSILAMGVALEQMFQATSRVVDRKMREVWSKSIEVASISYVLARQYTPLIPDQASLAGLVHQIGVLPILTYAERHRELIADPDSLNRVIEEIHPLIGDKILRKWDFPAPIATIPSQHLDFSRNSERVDYADVVQVAVLQSYLGTEHPFTKLDWGSIAAFAKLNLDPHVDTPANAEMVEGLAAAMGNA